MKIIANDIRIGNVLEYNGKLWIVSKTSHTQPGKGGAYMQVEMKEMRNGTKLNHRFRSGEEVERAHLDTKDLQYLYIDIDKIFLMDMKTYDQLEINKDLLGEDLVAFLKEGMMLKAQIYEDNPISLSLPEKVEAVVSECEAVVKGQTAASSYKPAILENGVRIMVPPFINQGDRVIVSTVTMEYLERA
jgi:elongation factor P